MEQKEKEKRRKERKGGKKFLIIQRVSSTSNPVCLAKPWPLTRPEAREMKFRCRSPPQKEEKTSLNSTDGPAFDIQRYRFSAFLVRRESQHHLQDLFGYKRADWIETLSPLYRPISIHLLRGTFIKERKREREKQIYHALV